jgi:hypothetical protein
MPTAKGTAPARSRHRGVNSFHPVDIDAQTLRFEVMDSRQYRQTWVKGTIGLGSTSDTKVAQDARTSGGRWFTGRSEFLKESTSRRTSLTCFSRVPICKKKIVNARGFHLGFWEHTSAVSVAIKPRDGGGIVERIRAHSLKSFLPNALMSCSRESSRAVSGVMVARINPGRTRPCRSISETRGNLTPVAQTNHSTQRLLVARLAFLHCRRTVGNQRVSWYLHRILPPGGDFWEFCKSCAAFNPNKHPAGQNPVTGGLGEGTRPP